MADKLAAMRVFPSGPEKGYDLDVKQVSGGLLLVSNFTVSAATSRGRRPGFDAAMRPELAKSAFERFVTFARNTGVPIATGEFGADMRVHIVNDGPLTLILDSRRRE
jgi:D-tyrosyl-tRNA(Tyr) deacylase